MAGLPGESPNHFDDLFKDREEWEAILSSLPDFGVDQNPDEIELPGPAIDQRPIVKWQLRAQVRSSAECGEPRRSS
ncbi:MAG: hypothetical protein Rhims3KO_32330 [Hyphomicrobiales bacterium]